MGLKKASSAWTAKHFGSSSIEDAMMQSGWPKLLREKYSLPDIAGINSYFFSLDGGGRDLIIEALRKNAVKVMVEIGSFLCGSAIQWLQAVEDLAVIAVDPWDRDFAATLERFDRNPLFQHCFARIPDRAAFIESVRAHGPYASALANVAPYLNRFFPARACSPAVLYELADLGIRPGLIYFDSNKVLDDLPVAARLFPGAILCGDDWTFGAAQGYPVREPILKLCHEHGFSCTVKGASWLLHPSANPGIVCARANPLARSFAQLKQFLKACLKP